MKRTEQKTVMSLSECCDALDTVMKWLREYEINPDELCLHSARVGEYCREFVTYFPNLDPEVARISGTLHDIGKAEPETFRIINNGNLLLPEEREEINQHPEIGYQAVKKIGFPDKICDAVHQHHEEWNGSGYPQGLREEEINPYAQIIHLIDHFCAHMEERSYKQSLPPAEAKEEILKEFKMGKHNPVLRENFLEFYNNLVFPNDLVN